jgi:hypothetical protein
MLFAAINITDANNGIDYISKFHNNLDIGNLTVDKFIDSLDDFVEENCLITEGAELDQYEKIKRDLKNMNFYFENNVSNESLQNYTVVNVEGTQLLLHEEDKKINTIIDEDPPSKQQSKNDDKDRDTLQKLKYYYDYQKDISDMNAHRILDGEIKKANELVPTLMYVNFVQVGQDDSNYPIQTHIVVGIKAKLYAVDSQDILNRLKLKYNDKNTMLNLIKASTREISFFKDFVFAVDRAKIDAISQSRRGSSSKIWKLLERRAIKSKMKRSMFMNNDASAITTLVISQEEVEYLKKTEYIDVENTRVISPIMDAYNLMCFTIADESLEVCKFLFDDGEDTYEILTFNNLEREQRDNSKKIVNMMSKLAR